MPQTIGVPTASSIGGAFKDYGAGAAGGAVVGLVSQLLGNGFLASLVAPVLAGSILKGTRGTVVSTIAGYSAGQQLIAGGLGGIFGGGAAPSGDEVI